MIVYQWSGQGQGLMNGCREYLILAEDEDGFIGDDANEKEAIEANTAPGFKFYHKYDTDTETNFCGLPFGRMLKVGI